MAISDSLTITVDAPADEVLAFLRDIDNQKNWFPGNTESEVLERDDEGRCTRARLVNDVKIAKDEFVLNYTHGPDTMSWELEKATAVQKHQRGSWTVVDKAGKSEATMKLEVETTLPLPGFLQRKTVKDTLKGATSAVLKNF